jgi:hypothetical protein
MKYEDKPPGLCDNSDSETEGSGWCCVKNSLKRELFDDARPVRSLPDSRAAPEVPRPASTASRSGGGAGEPFASAGINPGGPESDQNRDPQGIGAQSFASAVTIPVGPESDPIRDPQGIGVQSFASAGSNRWTGVELKNKFEALVECGVLSVRNKHAWSQRPPE